MSLDRRAKVAIGAGVAVVALPCLATSIVQRGWRAETAAALAALEAEGVGTSLASLGVEAPPTPEAVALARRFDAFDKLPTPVSYMSGTGPVDLRRHLAGDTHVLVYDRTTADEDAPPDARAAMPLLLERVARYEADVDALLRARRPIRFAVDWRKAFDAEMPHLMGLKNLANGLRTRAAWRSHEGDAAGAWADAERLVGLAGCLDDPSLIGRLVRLAITGLATLTVEELLQTGPPPPPAQAARLDRALAALEEGDGFQRAMRGELSTFERAVELGGDGLFFDGQMRIPLQGIGRVKARLFLDQWTRDWVAIMGRAIRACDERDPLTRHDALAALAAEANGSTMLVQILMPSLAKAHAKELDAAARLRMVRVALRLGGDPAAAPGDLPLDPWGGGAKLRWAVQNGVGRLWSIGADRSDGGGTLPSEDPDAPFVPATDLVVRVGRRP